MVSAMRRMFISLALVLLSLVARAQGSYVIDGMVSNVPKGTVIQLFRNVGDILQIVGSDTITANTFQFKGETIGDGTEPMTLLAMNGNVASYILDVYVRPGCHVKVDGEDMLAYTWDVESDIPEQQTRQKIVGAARQWWDKIQLSDIQEDSLRKLLRGEGVTEGQKASMKSMLDSLSKDKDVIMDNIVLAETKAMAGMPVNGAWLDALLGDAYFAESSGNQECMNAVKVLYEGLSDEWKNTTDGAELGTIVYPPKEIKKDEAVADGDLFDIDGNVHHIADFKGKYVLLDFWSIGCGPCIQSIPEMKEIAEAYKDSLAVVSQSLDTEEIWKQESVKHGITWYNLNDLKGRSGMAAKYSVSGIPHYVLISPTGTMTDKMVGYGEGNLKGFVGKYLNNK